MEYSHINLCLHFGNRIYRNRVIKDVVILHSSLAELRNYLMYFNNNPALLEQICIQPLSNYLNGGIVPELNYRSTDVSIVGEDISWTCSYTPSSISLLNATLFLEIAQEWKSFLELPPANGIFFLNRNTIS